MISILIFILMIAKSAILILKNLFLKFIFLNQLIYRQAQILKELKADLLCIMTFGLRLGRVH